MSVPPGNYTLEVRAPAYIASRQSIAVRGDSATLVVRVPPKKSRVTLVLSGSESAVVTIGNGSYVLSEGKPVSLFLRAGTYAVEVSQPCRANVSPFLTVDGSVDVVVSVECRGPSEVRDLGALAAVLNGSTIRTVRLNISLSSVGVSLLNGSVVDVVSISYERPVVIELFYTQCSGCRYLVPALRQIAEWRNVSVFSLTVSPLDDANVLARYVRENGVTWLVGWAPSSLRERLNVTNYPTVVVISQGRVVLISVGARAELEAPLQLVGPTVLSPLLQQVVSSDAYPVILFTLGVLLSVIAIALGGGYGEEGQEEADLYGNPAAFRSLEPGLRGASLEALERGAPGEEPEERDWW